MKLEWFAITCILIALFIHTTDSKIHNFNANAASIPNPPSIPTVEFTTHRKIDNELGIVCYTTIMSYDKIPQNFDTTCLVLPQPCDYSERKISVQNRTNGQNRK